MLLFYFFHSQAAVQNSHLLYPVEKTKWEIWTGWPFVILFFSFLVRFHKERSSDYTRRSFSRTNGSYKVVSSFGFRTIITITLGFFSINYYDFSSSQERVMTFNKHTAGKTQNSLDWKGPFLFDLSLHQGLKSLFSSLVASLGSGRCYMVSLESSLLQAG